MTYALHVLEAAEADLHEAIGWYEGISPDIGRAFRNCAREKAEHILQNPLAYAVQRGDIRRAHLGRFSYDIFFTVQGDAIIVIALFHSRRSPTVWQSRSSLI